MSRRNRRQVIGIALFPFLAVLICTMGALIVLLVLTVQQARKSAIAERAAKVEAAIPPGPSQEDLDRVARLKQVLDDAVWRKEILEQSRTSVQEELARSRDELSHLEGHIRDLQEKARALLAQAAQIDSGKRLDDSEIAKAREEAERLMAEIARREKELEDKKKQQTGEQWYALLPYDGPNGTRRRPIYIECSERGIVVQPEGIVLTPEDFQGPMGPGNPLDATLRAIREHIARNQPAGPKTEPYPLLIVRPSGVVAYSVARSAMKTWEDEFGYELIDDDTKLAYGDPDPALVETLNREVSLARKRQLAFAAAMPRRYQDEEQLTTFSPSSLEGYDPAAAGGPNAGGGFGMGTGARTQYATGGSSSRSPSGIPGGTGTGGNGLAGNGMGSSSSMQPSLGNPAGGSPNNIGPVGAPYAQQKSGSTGGGSAGGGTDVSGSPAAAGNRYASGGQASGVAGGNAASGGTSGSSTGRPPGSTSGAPSGGQSAASGQPATSGGSQKRYGAPSQSAGSGLARGTNNWGLPNSAGKATAITRPIRVLILPDRVVLIPERGDGRISEEIPLSPEIQVQEIDAMVASIQKRISSWGIAVNNGYWKPILSMEVSPDAEPRVVELSRALEGSGFELQRKTR